MRLSVPAVLFSTVFSQLLLLICIVYLPGSDSFDTIAVAQTLGVRPAALLRCLVNEFYFGRDSLEYARSIKELGLVSDNVQEAKTKLGQALAIETAYDESQTSIPTQRYLDGMEVVDTCVALANLLLREGANKEAERLLSRAVEVIQARELYQMYDVGFQYAQVLDLNKQSKLATRARHLAESWKDELSRLDEFRAPLEAAAGLPEKFRRGHALFYLTSYLSICAKALLLCDRLDEAQNYAQRCVAVSAEFSDYPHRSTDLSALGLIYAEKKEYLSAARTYDDCIILLNSIYAPDVLYLLPQYQSAAFARTSLKQKDLAAAMRQRSRDVFMFLFELRDKYTPPAHQKKFVPTAGSLVKVERGEQFYSGRVVSVQEGGRYKVHCIGFPSASAEVTVAREALLPHPGYGVCCASADKM